MRYLWTGLMALAIVTFVNIAQASEPIRLGDDQLDQVTAGAFVWPTFPTFTFPESPPFPTFVWWEFPDFDWSAFD